MFIFDYLSYIICFVLIFSLFYYFIIRIKYGFWAIQPVFHEYDFGFKLKPPGIISFSPPSKNKYTNFADIETFPFLNITSLQKQRFTHLIIHHYLFNKHTYFKQENIEPYFVGKSFISFYYNDTNLLDTLNGNIVVDRHIVGSITSRPLTVFIPKIANHFDPYFTVNFMDFICINKLHRKKGIVSQLIQTHEYNQRLLNSRCLVSLLKREGKHKLLKGIVPLCNYLSYGFQVIKWTKPNEFPANYNLIEINQQNFRFLHDFITNNSLEFDIIIKNDMANIMELIKTKNIFVYAVLTSNQMQCCYFFKNTCEYIEKDMKTLSCFGSICNCDDETFINGYIISFWKIASQHHFGFCLIDNISHNDIIINNIILKTRPVLIQENAFYFYNFAYPTFASNKCLILY